MWNCRDYVESSRDFIFLLLSIFHCDDLYMTNDHMNYFRSVFEISISNQYNLYGVNNLLYKVISYRQVILSISSILSHLVTLLWIIFSSIFKILQNRLKARSFSFILKTKKKQLVDQSSKIVWRRMEQVILVFFQTAL